MIFEMVVVTILVIILLTVISKRNPYPDTETIRAQLISMQREMDRLDDKLNTILQELGYEVRPY